MPDGDTTGMTTKELAEARRLCDAGLQSYLGIRHSSFMGRSFSYGILGGAIPAVLLFAFAGKLGVSSNVAIIPAGLGIVAGLGYGIMNVNRDDALHEVDFDETCEAVASDEDDDEESDEDESSE